MSVLLEARPYRPFKSSEEYLIAMKEDLAEWLNALYPELRVNLDNFMDRLDTGVPLCKVIVSYHLFILLSSYYSTIISWLFYYQNNIVFSGNFILHILKARVILYSFFFFLSVLFFKSSER